MLGHSFTCPDDLQYNRVYSMCDFDENVECGDRPVCNDWDEDCHEDTRPGPPDRAHFP